MFQFAAEFKYGLMLVAFLIAVTIAGALTPIHSDDTEVGTPIGLASNNCSVGSVPTVMQSIVNHPWATLSGGSSAIVAMCAKVNVVGMAESAYSSVRKLFSTPVVDVIVSQRGKAMAPFRAKLWHQ